MRGYEGILERWTFSERAGGGGGGGKDFLVG